MKKHQILQRLKDDFPGLDWEDTSYEFAEVSILEQFEAKISKTTSLDLCRVRRMRDDYITAMKLTARSPQIRFSVKVSFEDPNWKRLLLSKINEYPKHAPIPEMIKDIS